MYPEPVRAYLLGTLDDCEAAAVEQKYFTDRAFFLFTRDEETRLIEDYLAARLSPPETRQFEDRYLRVPELRARVEEVRQRPSVIRVQSRPVFRSLLLAAAMLVICASGVMFWLQRGAAPTPPRSASSDERPLLATLSLSPGVLKSEAGGMAEFASPAIRGNVKLVLELPGQLQRIPCVIGVSSASADGGWKEIWSTGQPVVSAPSKGGQQIAVVLDTAVLPEGDYLVQATGPGHQVRETYLFHVHPL